MAVHLDMRIQREAPNYLNVQREKKIPPSHGGDTQNKGAFRLAGVCVGLMCIVQATLNIVLRLYLPSQVPAEKLVNYCENNTLAKENALLRSVYNELYNEKKKLEDNFITLVKERDQLKKETKQLQDRLSKTAADLDKSGWVSFRSRLYYMSTQQKSWTQSRDDCATRNANLAIITSREEQDFIEMLRRGKSVWIGLSDRETEGVWKWVDGTAPNTFFWWSQEPNNYKGREHCVEIGYTPDDGREVTDVLNTWNDNDCSAKFFWICEKTIFI